MEVVQEQAKEQEHDHSTRRRSRAITDDGTRAVNDEHNGEQVRMVVDLDEPRVALGIEEDVEAEDLEEALTDDNVEALKALGYLDE